MVNHSTNKIIHGKTRLNYLPEVTEQLLQPPSLRSLRKVRAVHRLHPPDEDSDDGDEDSEVSSTAVGSHSSGLVQRPLTLQAEVDKQLEKFD